MDVSHSQTADGGEDGRRESLHRMGVDDVGSELVERLARGAVHTGKPLILRVPDRLAGRMRRMSELG